MHAYGRIRGWESFTYALSCLACGLLFEAIGLDLNMVIYAAVCLVVLAWSTTLRVPTVLHVGEHGRLGAVGTVLGESPRFRSFLSATLLLWFGFSGAWNFIPLKILDQGGGPLLIGFGAALGGLVEVPMMRSSSNLSERFGIRAVFMAGCIVYALGFLLWGLVDDPQVLSILTFLEGIAFALVFTMSVVIVGKLVTPTLYSTGQAVAATVGFGVAPILGGLVALVGGLAVPLGGLGIALRHAAAVFIEDGKRVLGARNALIGGELVPLGGFLLVLGHALAVLVENAEVLLRAAVAALGRAAEPLGRLDEILFDAFAVDVDQADVVRGRYVAGLRQRQPLLESGCEIAAAVGGCALREIRERGPREGQRQNGTQQDTLHRRSPPSLHLVGVSISRLARRGKMVAGSTGLQRLVRV